MPLRYFQKILIEIFRETVNRVISLAENLQLTKSASIAFDWSNANMG